MILNHKRVSVVMLMNFKEVTFSLYFELLDYFKIITGWFYLFLIKSSD